MFIAESIRNKTEECTIAECLNCIAEYSEWDVIGENLGLLGVELDKIAQRAYDSDPMPHLVELWDRSEPDGISWEKLYQALKKIVEMRSARSGSARRRHRLPEEPPLYDVLAWINEEEQGTVTGDCCHGASYTNLFHL